MSGESRCQVAVIGGGIVGLASAMAVQASGFRDVLVLEAEDSIATHQTGHNSGVIHSGLYYRPGSLKARWCAEGREALYAFCREHRIPHEPCGKLVVATHREELRRLEELRRRGQANGLRGVRQLNPEEMREIEPSVSGLAGLHVPETGIIDFSRVAAAFAECIRRNGGEVRLASRVRSVTIRQDGVDLGCGSDPIAARQVVNCGGLFSDRIARLAGERPEVRIVPFRGEYHLLRPERQGLVRNLIYPVPDPRFPFLGVHFTRRLKGGVEAGPNAVLALRREGYRKTDFSLRDSMELLAFPGFWRMAARYWRTGMGEVWRSCSRAATARALRRLVPGLRAADLLPGGAGVRAQALDRGGNLLDDFRVIRSGPLVHVLNAPSPAATASLRIGRAIAEMVAETRS